MSYAGHAVLWAKTRPFPASPLAAKTVLRPRPLTAHIPPPSRGENGGLCPHPPKGPVPWVSLFENRPTSLASGMPSYGRKRALSQLRRSRRRPSCSTARDCHIPPAIPRGERRALPAPAQGTSPLGIPFLGNRSTSFTPSMAVLWAKTRPFPASPPAAKTVFRPPPATAIFPRHPAGRTAGSARTRPRVQTLEESLFGERPTSLTSGTASYGRKRDLSRQNVPQRPPVAKTVLRPPPATAIFPRHSAGRTAGSARTRSRVQTLEDPFLGSGCHLPPLPPSPKTPQAASPCSWACRRLRPLPPQPERNAEHPPPARGVGVCQIRANGAGRRHCRPARLVCQNGDGGCGQRSERRRPRRRRSVWPWPRSCRGQRRFQLDGGNALAGGNGLGGVDDLAVHFSVNTTLLALFSLLASVASTARPVWSNTSMSPVCVAR